MRGNESSPGFYSSLTAGYRPCLVLCGIVALLYMHVLSFDYTYLDDYSLIKENKSLLSSFGNFPKLFSQDVFSMLKGSEDSYYRPLLTLSFMLDYHLGGESPVIYHLTNILLHALACCLLFRFLLLFGYRRELCFLFSLSFAVHPAISQTVAWIPGRNDSLLAVFALASFLFLAEAMDTGKVKFSGLNLLFFFFALLTKETALLLPLLYAFFVFIYPVKGVTKSTTKLTYLAGWAALVFVYVLMRGHALKSSASAGMVADSLLENLAGLIVYPGKLILPLGLSVFPILEDSMLWPGLLVIAFLALLFFRSKNKRTGIVLFSMAWLLLLILPAVLSVQQFEHRLYLPAVGMIIFLLETLFTRNEAAGAKKAKQQPVALPFSVKWFSLLMVVMAAGAFYHSGFFRNEECFWTNATQTSSHSPIAWTQLGTHYQVDKKNEQAEQCYLRAISLDPDMRDASNNLGKLYLDRGMSQQAEPLFRREIAVNPQNVKAYDNLGTILFEKDSLAGAEKLLRTALAIDPGYTDALNDLAAIYGKQQKFREAVELWKKVIALNPAQAAAYKNLVYVLVYLKNYGEAKHYRDELLQRGVEMKVPALDSLK